jgi:hypothetical protein
MRGGPVPFARLGGSPEILPDEVQDTAIGDDFVVSR